MASKKTINQHREEVIKSLSELNAYSKTMRDDIIEVKDMIKEQNGRVRKTKKKTWSSKKKPKNYLG